MKKAFTHRRLFLISVIITLFLLVGYWLTWSAVAPKPLGAKLEYIGKENYGCWLVCDSNPESTYYYATDMNIEEVIGYFKKAVPSQSPRAFDGITDFTLKTKNGNTISVYYYTDESKLHNESFTKKTRKKAILSIPSFQYDSARGSL